MSIAPRTTHNRRARSRVGSLLAAFFMAPLLVAESGRAEENFEAVGFEKTPPRLSLVSGEASFWRPGADDWSQAQINTPLAAGDELYTAAAANLEIQVGGRAFVRAGEETQISVYALEPDYLQLRVADGDVALDLRDLSSGQTFEVNTPNAAFVVEQAGYYRLTVDGATSTFTNRRGGRALVTPASGASVALDASERIVVSGDQSVHVATYAAPDIDTWDRWNYARTDRQLKSVSARYVSQDVYGLADLDEHGDWRQVPTYGAVWVPRRVAVDWVPYSHGRWLYDPFYGWSWVDYSPWGWAPFHYGRWVHVSGFWGWSPGPVVVRPYYAPALVAFYGGPSISVGVSFGAPFGWVALGWGEPLAPWWGPTYFRRRACWAGWGGPRYVNNVYIHNETIVHVDRIRHHDHARRRRGVVVVDRDGFGRRGVDPDRRRRDVDGLTPVRGDLPMRPGRESLRPGERAGRRPSRELLDRRVVSTREPRIDRVAVDSSNDGPGRRPAGDQLASAPPRIVQPTRREAVRAGRRADGELSTVDRRGREVAPALPGDAATRGERRASRFEEAARQRVDQSLHESPERRGAAARDGRRRDLPTRDDPTWRGQDRQPAERQRAAVPSSVPDAGVRERRRAAPPPLPSSDAARQRVERRQGPRRAVPEERSAPETGVRERRRAAPPPLPSRDDATRQRVERRERPSREAPQARSAPNDNARVRDSRRAAPAVPRADTRRDDATRQRLQAAPRELRAAPAPPVRGQRQPERVERQPERVERQPERVERRTAPAVTARREAPSYRPPDRQQAPAYRSAPRREPERRSAVRMPRFGADAGQRGMSGSMRQPQSAPRAQNYGSPSAGGAMRGGRRGGDGRR